MTTAAADNRIDSPDAPPSGRAALLALIVVLVAAFMDLLDATIVSIAAPDIAADLGASEAVLQWTVAGYTLALGSALVTGGRIGDQFGRRRIFLIGLALFALASAACALAPTPATLVVARVLQGLAGGLMVPQVFGVISTSFEPGLRAKAFGAYGAVLGAAAVAGPLLGGFLVDADLFGLGWRTIFLINIPVAVVGLILGFRYLPESKSSTRAPLDIVGAVLASATSVLVLLPLVQGRDWGWPWWSFALLALSVPTAWAFLARERSLLNKGEVPILDPALLRIRAFAGGLAAAVLFFGAIGSFFLMFSLYLQSGTGRSAWETGLVMLPYAIGSIITSGIGVQFADRFGRAILVTGALVLGASQVGLLVLLHDGGEPGYWWFALPMFIGGLGLGFTAPSLMNVVLAGVPGRDAGVAGGVLTTVIQIGNAIGIAVLGLVFFGALDDAAPERFQADSLGVYSDAFVSILPWQIACYVGAAALMMLLPKRAAAHQ